MDTLLANKTINCQNSRLIWNQHNFCSSMSSMSTFSGFIDGIKNVSVDRFVPFNLEESRVFFLSHCHTDHMIGLNKISESNPLPGPLYLSEISRVILRRRYPRIKHLITLKIGEEMPISINDPNYPERLCVTAISAGHCPGSIMLLFEHGEHKVLYTGDFRLYSSDIQRIEALKKFQETAELDCLHLDSTFLSMNYLYFPRQCESVATILKLAETWLTANEANVVFLRPPAVYGYEYLLVKIAQHFKIKIHVSDTIFEDYLYIPILDDHISNNQLKCGRIHLCLSEGGFNKWETKKSTCLPKIDDRCVRIIRPTAMKWENLCATDQIYEINTNNTYFVCYSNHASLDEIKFLIQYLHPKLVKLNVVPKDRHQVNEMNHLLNEICENVQNKPKSQSELIPKINESHISETRIQAFSNSMSREISDETTPKLKKRRIIIK